MTQTISGGDIIVRALADEGVDTIFGYSGGAILPTYDSIFRFNEDCEKNGRKPIQLVVPASEQGAGFMAAGYARSTGKVGVFMVTSGPGATNSVTPIRDCMADSVPVVLITGQVPAGCPRFGCISGSAGVQPDEHLRQARFPGDRSGGAGGHHPFRVRDCEKRPARSRRRRYSEGRSELDGRLPGKGHTHAARL